MIRPSNIMVALAILMATASPTPAQSGGREPENLDSFFLGEQVAGSRLTYDDLEGRVVLAYHWCVS